MSRSSGLVVADANIAVHAVLETDLSASAERAWLTWKEAGVDICAPRQWLYEVTSAIHRIYMLRQITEQHALEALDIALALGVQIVPDDGLAHEAFRWATRMHRVATYDCFYLALAEHLGAEFWTADKALASVSQQAGLPWVHWIGEPSSDESTM